MKKEFKQAADSFIDKCAELNAYIQKINVEKGQYYFPDNYALTTRMVEHIEQAERHVALLASLAAIEKKLNVTK